MARKVIKTLAQQMAVSGKEPAKDVLDDTDLADDPIVSAIQSLRAVVDDLQHNDDGYGVNRSLSAIQANTAKNTNVSTNLSKTVSGTGFAINSSDGNNIALSLADTDNWGLMSDEMFDKLDGIEARADNVDATNVKANLPAGVLSSSLQIFTNVTASGNISSSATITANAFVGDGSNLTSLPAQTANDFTNTLKGKLDGVEASSTADQSNAEILTAIEDGVDSVHYKDGSIDTEHIGDDQVTADKLANSINSAIAANTAKNTNADQSKADINALDITEVGTISSGVWQGTTIKTAYIGDDQVTADKIGNDVINSEHYAAASIDNEHLADNAVDTAEIAASAVETAKINNAAVTMAKLANIATDTFIGRTASNTGVPKALSKTEALAILNVENGATADQSDAEILTAIEDGVDSVHYKDGSIDTDHIADDQVTADKLANSINSAIAANTAKNTNADQSKADINALDITEVGTISSGVWQGTTIKTAYIGDDQVTADKLANSINSAIAANTNKTVLVVGTGSGNAKAGNTTTISSGQASAISANTSKVGFVTTMPTATEGVTCTLTATKNRGVINALVFTVIDSSGRSPVTKTATIALE